MSDVPDSGEVQPLVRYSQRAAREPLATGDSRLLDLSAMTGMQRLKMHQGQLAPGADPCPLPGQQWDEMFLEILSGTGELECDGQRVLLAAGDILTLSHPDGQPTIRNTGGERLTWLSGSL